MMNYIEETIEIPDFRFENRYKEQLALNDFCESESSEIDVLLIQGAEGFGKSRLLNEVDSLKDESVFVSSLCVNPIKRSERTVRQLLETRYQEARNECNSNNSKHRKDTVKRKKRVEFTKKIGPAILNFIPVLGKGTSETFKIILKSNTEESILSHLIDAYIDCVCRVSLQKRTIILIDGIDDFDSSELEIYRKLIARLQAKKSTSIKVIISVRKLDSSPIENALNSLNQQGRLKHMNLRNLNDTCLEAISSSLFFNSERASTLMRFSNNNLKDLRLNIMRLNLNGALARVGEKLVLPPDKRVLSWLHKELDLIKDENLESSTLIMMVLLGGVMLNSQMRLFAEKLSVSIQDVQSSLERLERLKLVYSSLSKDLEIYYSFFDRDFEAQIALKIDSLTIARRTRLREVSCEIYENTINEVRNTLDFSDLEILDHEVNYVLNKVLICADGWQKRAYRLAQVCVQNFKFIEANELIRPVIKSWLGVIDTKEGLYTKAQEIEAISLYKLGKYSELSRRNLQLKDHDWLTVYSYYMSTLITKDKSWFEKIATIPDIVQSLRFPLGESTLLESIYYIALRENGLAKEGEYGLNQLFRERFTRIEKVFSSHLGVIAAPYLERELSRKVMAQAYKYYKRVGFVRLLGILATNIAISYIAEKNYKKAIKWSHHSHNFLEEAGAGDSVFPLINLACISLLSEELDEANEYLQMCLFQNLPQEQETTVKLNKMLVEFQLSERFDKNFAIECLESNSNSWLAWILAYNTAFLMIKSSGRYVSENTIIEAYTLIMKHDPECRSAILWNSLLEEQSLFRKIEKYKIENVGVDSPIQGLCDSYEQYGRPVFMSFGHI